MEFFKLSALDRLTLSFVLFFLWFIFFWIVSLKSLNIFFCWFISCFCCCFNFCLNRFLLLLRFLRFLLWSLFWVLLVLVRSFWMIGEWKLEYLLKYGRLSASVYVWRGFWWFSVELLLFCRCRLEFFFISFKVFFRVRLGEGIFKSKGFNCVNIYILINFCFVI